MQRTERQDYQTKINKLNSSNHRGFSFRKRIKLLQQWFTAFLQLRKSLVKLNTSTILENVEKSARLNNLATEAEKLLSADKIHNFTNIELPQDFKDLWTKAPTSSLLWTILKSNLSKTQSRMKLTKHYVLSFERKNHLQARLRSKLRKLKTDSNHTVPYTPLLYWNNNRTDQVSTSTSLTMFTTRYPLQSNSCTPLTSAPTSMSITAMQTYTKPPMSPNYVRAMILTMAEKTMGWAFVPTHWFRTEYDGHFSDTDTYKRIDNFNLA